jgi:hypothetical protein
MGRRWLMFAAVVVCGVASRAGAYSPDWMKTAHDIRALSLFIKEFRETRGHYPATTSEQTWFDQLVDLHDDRWIASTFYSKDGVALDRFGHPYIYEPPADLFAEPGTPEAAYRLASVGADGIDDRGEKDDLTLGRPINDGYYGYVNRPRMRGLAASFGAVFVVIVGVAARFARQRVPLLLAASSWAAVGCIVCIPLHYTGFGLGGNSGDPWNYVYGFAWLWLPVSLLAIPVLIVIANRRQRGRVVHASNVGEGSAP